jgi:LmbE family N-acetylglucosaminyl deacetylase
MMPCAARDPLRRTVGDEMDDLGTILGVWAHPDDETYLSAGLMARAVRAGARVVCVTATRGEGGSMDEERWPPETMGRVRTEELERSMEILGVTEHHWLDLPDVDMQTGLPEHGYGRVRDLVAEVQPDTILTFGPEGMTGHEAHKDVSRWATQALVEAGAPGSRALYACVTPEWADEFLPIWEPFNVFLPGTPQVVPREELAVHYELPPDVLETKVRAINAHVSQIEAILEAVGEDVWWKEMSLEAFRTGREKA